MRRKLSWFLIPCFAILVSCEKVIDIDLDNADEILVIEANVTNEFAVQTVKLTKTVPFSNANAFPSVTGAKVIITEENGRTLNFTERRPGIYQRSFQGISGKKYFLNVTLGNKG